MFNNNESEFPEYVNRFGMNNDDDDDVEEEEEEEEDNDDDGISFEKYVELRTKMDPYGDDKSEHNRILQSEGYTREDWDFYEKVWTVEMANPERLNQFSELYATYSKKK